MADCNLLAHALRLGRLSILPAVWTNHARRHRALGGVLSNTSVVPLRISLSLLRVAGMYLNHDFDAGIDARGPTAPTPQGEAAFGTVFAATFGHKSARHRR